MFTEAFAKSVMRLIMAISFAGCATSGVKKRELFGKYRWGADSNNAEYLVLEADGSYLLTAQSNSAVDRKVAPYVAQRSYGNWMFSRGKVVLRPIGNSVKIFDRRIFLVLRKGGRYELRPVLGAEWSPDAGFVSIN